jgi:hypothetical protein
MPCATAPKDEGGERYPRLLGDRSIAVRQKFGLGDIAFGPSPATFQSALPDLTGGAHYPNLAAFSAPHRGRHRSPAPFQFREDFDKIV